MGKNDENKENRNEFCQPLLPEDKSDYLISSSSSSATSHLSDLVAAEVAAAASLRNLQQSSSASATLRNETTSTKSCSIDVCDSGIDQRRFSFSAVQPGCTQSVTNQESSSITNIRNQRSTNNSICSPTISIDRDTPIVQVDSGNECSVGSPTLESSTDSQQALFAPEAKSTHFYKRWFFNRSRQLPTSSAKIIPINVSTQSTSSASSSASHSISSNHHHNSNSASNPTSSGNGTRKRKMINLSQYNNYLKEDKNGVRANHLKHKKQGKKCNNLSSTSGSCICNSNVDLTLVHGNRDEEGDDHSLPIVLPGPSGLQSAQTSPNCCLSESSDSLSRSSSSEHFTFDSDEEDDDENLYHNHHIQVELDDCENTSDDNPQRRTQRRRQPSAEDVKETEEVLLGVHRPLMSDSEQPNGCKMTSDTMNQQLLNAQALCSAPETASEVGPTEEQLTVSSGDSRCKKSILLPQLHQDCKRKPNSNTNGKGNLNHLQVNSTTLGGSLSQLSVTSSLFTDPLLPICKICHLNGKEGDPLISPCKCAGTMQFIHCGCLMRWLEISSKKTRKPLSCELCQYQYHWHKKFKVDHLQFPYCSQKDKLLHLLFFISLCVMIACAVVTVLCFKRDRLQRLDLNGRSELSDSELSTLICGVLFFLSFFTAMYVQVKAHNTLYRLVIKFIYLNQQWYIDEYEKKDGSPSPVDV